MPCIVYAFFGSSRQLAVGPVAVTSLLIGAGLKSLVPGAEDITNPNSLTGEQVRTTLFIVIHCDADGIDMGAPAHRCG